MDSSQGTSMPIPFALCLWACKRHTAIGSGGAGWLSGNPSPRFPKPSGVHHPQKTGESKLMERPTESGRARWVDGGAGIVLEARSSATDGGEQTGKYTENLLPHLGFHILIGYK